MLVGVIESKSPLASSLTKRLLSSGAAADTWAPSGLSALMSASSTMQTEVAALLIAGSAAQERSCLLQQRSGTGATIELADAQGRTALMHAAMNNCVPAIRLLLAHGAQVCLGILYLHCFPWQPHCMHKSLYRLGQECRLTLKTSQGREPLIYVHLNAMQLSFSGSTCSGSKAKAIKLLHSAFRRKQKAICMQISSVDMTRRVWCEPPLHRKENMGTTATRVSWKARAAVMNVVETCLFQELPNIIHTATYLMPYHVPCHLAVSWSACVLDCTQTFIRT